MKLIGLGLTYAMVLVVVKNNKQSSRAIAMDRNSSDNSQRSRLDLMVGQVVELRVLGCYCIGLWRQKSKCDLWFWSLLFEEFGGGFEWR